MNYPLLTLGVMGAVALGTVLYYYLTDEDLMQVYGYRENESNAPSHESLQNHPTSQKRIFKANPEYRNGCCTICLDSLKANKLKRVSCGHVYHEDCINKWLVTKSTCPLCRAGTQ